MWPVDSKAWKGHAAVGSQELGVDLFDGNESPQETLIVAYSLEQGLREYYLSMVKKVKNTQVQELFSLLAEIEVKHQARLFQQFLELSDTTPTLEAFENEIVVNAVEGGMTTDEYANMYNPDWESPRGCYLHCHVHRGPGPGHVPAHGRKGWQ